MTGPMPGHVYFDTDVFHRVGQVVENSPLSPDLRERILVSPITALEALSHLSLRKNDEILRHIHALHNWVNPEHTGLLPWPSVAIANLGFGKKLEEEESVVNVETGINICLSTDSAADLRESAGKLKNALDRMKADTAINFQRLVESYRKEPLKDGQFSEVWAHGIALRVKTDPKSRPVSEIVAALSAYYEFEEERLKVAASNPAYRPEPNDLLDSEQLVYLGNSGLHFLTCDGGYFARIKNSAQLPRIHKVSLQELGDRDKVVSLLNAITA
jgi:hypothetical protein